MDISSPPVGSDRVRLEDEETFRECAGRIIDSQKDVFVMYCDCSVTYSGGANGFLEESSRLLIFKPDGTVQVHGTTGYKPRAWITTQDRPKFEINTDYMNIVCSGKEKKISIDIYELHATTRYRVGMDKKMEMTGTETDMHKHIISNPSIISDKFSVLSHEKEVNNGRRIDIFGRENDRLVVVEVKKKKAVAKHIDQLSEYVRIISEEYDRDVRGVLVSPSTTETAERSLEQHDFTHVSLSPSDVAC